MSKVLSIKEVAGQAEAEFFLSNNREAIWQRYCGFFDLSLDEFMLIQGAFKAYMAARQAEGTDLAHIKPPYVNPSDKVLSLLGVKVGAVST